ncbi:MAG: thiamine diphosphokinase [Pseudorhodobacter sp.]
MTLVAGGPVRAQDLQDARALAPVVVAIDGGADRVLDLGMMPEAVIGDMDSLSQAGRARLDPATIITVQEQIETDFYKSLQHVRAPFIVALGCLGGQVDHELAVFASLIRRGGACLLVGARDVVFAAPPCRWIDLALVAGDRVSLFPMLPVTGKAEGLFWPIDELDFHPMGRIGTSNRATGPVRMCFAGRGMLVILPRERLSAALAGLRSAG